jgi:hypothetical protein
MKIRWVGHLARMRKCTGTYRVLLGKPEGKKHSEDLTYVRNVLELMLKKSVVGVY